MHFLGLLAGVFLGVTLIGTVFFFVRRDYRQRAAAAASAPARSTASPGTAPDAG